MDRYLQPALFGDFGNDDVSTIRNLERFNRKAFPIPYLNANSVNDKQQRQHTNSHSSKRTIDSIGGANLLKRAVDRLGGGHLLKKR